jgi:hypothetical protein
LLADETRLDIIRTLGEAKRPLGFSELFDRVNYDDSSNFGYHLKRLTDHFVQQVDEGYVLGQPGRRVVEAVLSGVVTDDAVQEPSRADRRCQYCGTRIEVTYQQERVEMHCPNCPGLEQRPPTEGGEFDRSGNLGHLLLPPSGLSDRSPDELLRAAEIWTGTETLAIARGVCGRCSAPLEQSVTACEAHDAAAGRCDACGQRFGAMFQANCTNCVFEMQAPMVTYLACQAELIEFMLDHGIDPLSSEAFDFPHTVVEETIHSSEPFAANYQFSTEQRSLTLEVDEQLTVSTVNGTKYR